MSDRLKALRENRGKIVTNMREILDKAEAEKRSLTDEEQAKHDELFEEQEGLRVKVVSEERQVELDREMAESAAAEERAKAAAKPGETNDNATTAELQLEGFRNYLRSGTVAGRGAEEFRALQADSDTEGGFVVPPEQVVARLIKFVDDAVFIRGRATVLSVPNADSLGVPSLDADPADADWTTELATGNEDSTMAFGKRSLHPHPLAKRIKLSNKLVRASAIDIDGFVLERLGYKFGITSEKAYLTGTGAQQPLGIYVASADGIPTSRDVSTGNTTTEIKFDGLLEAKYSLKGAYWPNAVWNFHRDAMKQISKLKDGEGQYIWRQSTREGEPDSILGHPFDMSEYTPNTFTTGLYVGAFGDFSHYWIADALSMQFQRLVELYAETNQVGFIGRMESDGMPVLAEAFARVTLA